MEYFIAAYTVIWLVLFAFVLLMNRRTNKIEEELEIVEEIVGSIKDGEEEGAFPAPAR